jgi:outer membrane protein assembly factor BamB
MKRLLLVLVLLVVAAAGAAAVWVWKQTRTKEVRGSPTVEFVSTAAPELVEPRPKKVVANTPWPIYGYDPQRTRVARDLHLRPPFRKVWSVRLGNSVEFPPVVAYDGVFVNQIRGRFFKIHAKTGEVLFRKHYRNCSAASPAAGDRVVYVALMQPYPCRRYPRSQPGYISALRARGGRELWRFRAGAVESSPLLVNRTLYFGSWDGNVYALDVRGKRPRLRWRFRADDEVNTSPAYAGGAIYFATDGGSLYAVDARTGRMRWHATSFSHFPRGREYFYATPTVAYGRVFIGNTDGTVYAYGAGTGNLLWAKHVGSYVYTAAAVWERTVLVGTYDGYVVALDAATGAERWRHSAPSALHGAPTVLSGLVYFSSCGTCGQRGSRSARAGPRTTFALDARTGRLVWSFPDGQYSPVVADSERIYVTGRTRIYAFEPVKRGKKKASS